MSETIRLHGLLPATRANGPGLRVAIWVQGCSLACVGCFNPATHPSNKGIAKSVSWLLGWVAAQQHIEGVTLTGGEPVQQWEPVRALMAGLRGRLPELSQILLTGYTLRELDRMRRLDEIEGLADVVIAGRFREDLRVAHGLRGSSNKSVLLCSGRYSQEDIDATPEAEMIIALDGSIVETGIDPMGVGAWRT